MLNLVSKDETSQLSTKVAEKLGNFCLKSVIKFKIKQLTFIQKRDTYGLPQYRHHRAR
jgi:hypothetical protein